MASTNVPRPTLGPKGYIAPTEAEILEGTKLDVNQAFGGKLNMALATPQGQLASSRAAIVGNVNDTFLYYTNQVDPAYAEGRMQDAIARIYFIERKGAQPSVVNATCTGAQGTVIPAGAIAQDASGNLWIATADATIPAAGSVVVPFSCATLGPIACPVGALDTIYQTILGWDEIENLEEGVLGRDTETRAEFEERRFASVAKNSAGSLGAVRGSVLDVAGVLDAYVTENDSSSPVTIRGVTLAAKSLYVAAVGGAQAEVADAIWRKKAPGCATNGNTTVTVYDTEDYSPPYPSYQINYEVPAALPIIFSVNLVNNAQIPDDAQQQIQEAIILAFAGADGGPRARIGSTVYASRFYGAVAALGAWAQIVSIDIGSQNAAAATVTGFIDDGTGGGSPSGVAGTKMTVTAVGSGALDDGQTVVGSGVLPGTKIVSQDSGTPGGIGVYTVSFSQDLAPAQTLYGVVADQNSVDSNIDQAPSVSADDITVNLT